jgi:TetR/AcrR family transcriptional repressor of nem operon
MKKSRAETAETRLRIIAVASKLFLERGIAETGVADVMVAAGLTQGGFYRHFESKEQLVAEANRSANESLFSFYDSATQGLPPREAMKTMVHLYLTQAMGSDGQALCPLANLGSELRHSNEHIRAVAMEGYQQLVAAFNVLGQQAGIERHTCIASSIVSTIVGSVTLSRLSVDQSLTEEILKNAEYVVGVLLQRKS